MMGAKAKINEIQKRLAEQNGKAAGTPEQSNLKDFPAAIRQQLVMLGMQVSTLEGKVEALKQLQMNIAGNYLRQIGYEPSPQIIIDVAAGTFTLPERSKTTIKEESLGSDIPINP